jgi:hypothetical protein
VLLHVSAYLSTYLTCCICFPVSYYCYYYDDIFVSYYFVRSVEIMQKEIDHMTFLPGMLRDAQGCPGMPRDAQGCPGMPRDTQRCVRDISTCHVLELKAHDIFPRDVRLPRDAQGCLGMPRDAQRNSGKLKDAQG